SQPPGRNRARSRRHTPPHPAHEYTTERSQIMIALPFNDGECLEAISRTVAQMAEDRDPIFVELAEQYPTAEHLVEYIRSLPQRDDLGDPNDGPRVKACSPPQRVRERSD